MAQADSGSIINIALHDAINIAQSGCSYGWAAQVVKCFAEHGKSSPPAHWWLVLLPTIDRLQWESLSAGCMLPSSTAALSAGLRKLACELLARRASGHVCPQSISCLLCAISLTGPDSRSSLCLQPSWTLEMPMTACSTLSSGRPYSAREFMARCLQPYSHCIVEVQ